MVKNHEININKGETLGNRRRYTSNWNRWRIQDIKHNFKEMKKDVVFSETMRQIINKNIWRVDRKCGRITLRKQCTRICFRATEEVQDWEDKGDSILRSKFYRGLKGHKSGEAVRIYKITWEVLHSVVEIGEERICKLMCKMYESGDISSRLGRV